MLSVMALAAFMSDAGAQTRRSSQSSQTTRSSQTSQSAQTRRSSSAVQNRQSNDERKSTAVRPSNTTRKPVARQSSGADRKPSTTVNRPVAQDRREEKPKQVTRPAPARPQQGVKPGNNNGNRPEVRPEGRPDNRPDNRPGDRPDRDHGMKPGNGPGHGPGHGPGKPVQVRPDHRHDHPRVHPRDRDFMRWDRPSYHWSHSDHYYGYRVRILPTRAHRHVYHGVVYYCYNDIWYRPYGGYYIVCRPPHGLALAADIISDIAWTAVRLSYYNTVANTYSTINENNAYIAEQNEIIAKNNAVIAAQNASIAQNQQLAQTSYTLANELGLVQSYAAADAEYFYQDGVFYAKDAAGEYKVILPPAGALVEALPEDFDTVTLKDGNEYYKVEDTIFKVSVLDGKPYFEVVGQQYS